MAKTKIKITVEIEHDTQHTKKQGLDIWCNHLKIGQNVRGHNGMGDGYSLMVTNIEEIEIEIE